MNTSIDDPSWLPRHRDALMLANLLRVSRLTLLHGEAGAGKSALLKNELLALLRRRATDLAPQAASPARVVVPFPDRRNGGRFAAHGEVAVFFDAWDHEDPLSGLLARIEAELGIGAATPPTPQQPMSLADTLLRLGQRHGTRLLIILDGFEAHLAADPEDAAARRFADALAQVLNHPGVPAHFFIVVRDDAQPLLDPWRARVPGFGDRWLRIRHWSSLLPRPADDNEGAPAASASERPQPPTLVRSAVAAFSTTAAAVEKAPDPEAHPGLELGIDLYLPLPPQESRPPSERVQALWDQLLSRPIAHRPPAPAATPAAPPITAPVAAVAPPPDTLPAPQPALDTPSEPIVVEFPVPRRTPWMAWSLAVIVVAALMIYAWGDSLQDKPPAQQAPIASGVEPARGP